MIITSSKNKEILNLKKIINQKDVICLDNPKLIAEAISCGLQILAVIKTEKYIHNITNQDIIVTDNVFKLFTNTTTSQGVVAIIKFIGKELKPPDTNFLVLDRVQDPGNVGTLIRSAVGAGFVNIYLVDCALISNSKVVRSSMGAIFRANIYQVSSEFFDILKKWNLTLLAADMQGQNIYTKTYSQKCGVVIGNEGNGVSDNFLSICSDKVSIPMKNNLESLNAAVSGSIIMYQIANGGKYVRT